MAEAPTLETLTPKQLGKHLRAVRRRKGLSQSEVARGAGLTRRELNAYEKGRIPVPDSDLFVIAGSCGVDVSELRSTPSMPELEIAPVADATPPVVADLPMPSSIEDTVAQLRRGQEVAPPPAPSLTGRRRARAIEAASEAANAPWHEPAEEDWSIERIDPLEAVQWPSDASLGASDTSFPSPAQPIDVFEELRRLSDPSPLGDASEADTYDAIGGSDVPLPPGAVEGFDQQPYEDEWPAFESDYESDFDPQHGDSDAEPVLVEMPNAQATVADMTSAADAPPIDVAMRGESYASPWDSLESAAQFAGPDSLPEVTDVWEPVLATQDTELGAFDLHEDGGWTTQTADPLDAAAPVEAFDPRFGTATPFEAAPGAWTHEPDPEATSTGFYVDWGDPGTEAPETTSEQGVAEPASWDPLAPQLIDEPAFDEPAFDEPAFDEPAFDEPAFDDVGVDTEPDDEVQLDDDVELDDEPPLISWRPQWDDSLDAAIGAVAVLDADPPAPEPELEPESTEEFVVAGSEWVLGNAVPLVEVRSTGSLVMRRADERWALADVTAASNFALEAYVDLRSGPGFGLLFRAVIDDDGRMSGYSFDVDPVYEGGSYLVREWRADRELWNPIARVPAPEPETMRGLLVVRLTVDDDRLVAAVNGAPVLEVESLKQASADRGREGASGDRVGIQAWSSTDLVIDELRVAQR